jgi:hypothetical protein
MSVIAYEEALTALQENIKEKAFKTERLNFSGVGKRDVYNITAPFGSAGKTIIGGRVENRDSEQSILMFFEEKNNIWSPIENANSFDLQDPFFTRIDDMLIVGGVEIAPSPCGTPGKLTWRTIFFKGKDIYSLERFFQGPEHMKDIRIVELSNKRIGVFTRPQGSHGGRGKIGYTEVGSLNDLNEDVILGAKLLEQFHPDEWGGANEVHLLKNGKLGVLAHIAKFSNEGKDRHYAASAFLFDPTTNDYSQMKIIACRDLFNEGNAKRPDLKDVIFSGGLKRMENGKAILYAGAGDAEAYWLEIDDPFCEWENL